MRIIGDSLPYTNQWLQLQPTRDPAAPLFPSSTDRDAEMSYAAFAKRLKGIGQRAGLKRKRLHPHLFRHTAATRMANSVSESILESQLGWTAGSAMSRIYVHLNMKDVDEAMMTAAGIEIPKKDRTVRFDIPLKCKRCDKMNASGAQFCAFCGLPQTLEAMERQKGINDYIEGRLVEDGRIDANLKDIIDSIDVSIKDQLLLAVLKQAQKEKRLEGQIPRPLNPSR